MIRNFTSVTKLYGIENEFEQYVVVENGITKFVPLDTANSDYQAIQDWIAAGNSVVDPNAE